MASIIDKVKSATHKALAKGSKIPTHALKEENPEQATVNLHQIPGKSMFPSSSLS